MDRQSEAPAIVWSEHRSVSVCYWNTALLASLSSTEHQSQSTVSYETLRRVNDRVSLDLWEMIIKCLKGDDVVSELIPEDEGRKSLGVPIAVAIPEGPLLPIAVLAVHTLNQEVHFRNGMFVYAILVPLDPSDGEQRLLHMLNDSRPRLVLCIPGRETDHLNLVLKKINAVDDSRRLDSLIYVSPRTELIDFGRMVQVALDGQKTGTILGIEKEANSSNHISHIVYTSGTLGRPKGCVSSRKSLLNYLQAKNKVHGIGASSTVLLASALSFDPCLSDILATFKAGATLVVSPRNLMYSNPIKIIQDLKVSHVLCTPSLWSLVHVMGARPSDLPSLKVVALGGEPIPKQIVRAWARDVDNSDPSLRLCVTYGVTEACVYQSFGEVFWDSKFTGKLVGQPFPDIQVRICREDNQSDLEDVIGEDQAGEIVLSGSQLDEFSFYLNQPELTRKKFFQLELSHGLCCTYYRTGDRGRITPGSLEFSILGRIVGEEGMLKINGVRIEIKEIEASIIDSDNDNEAGNLISDCCVTVQSTKGIDSSVSHKIRAFCIPSRACLKEIRLTDSQEALAKCLAIDDSVFLQLLKTRCRSRIKQACVPSEFFFIPSVPLSPTGKRDYSRLPNVEDCGSLRSFMGLDDTNRVLLRHHGRSGSILATVVVDCLNLQPFQEQTLYTDCSFGILGGDSLVATRVVRALYAYHHRVQNSRFLGGEYGVFEGPFDVVHLLSAGALGEYVDFLDSHQVCIPGNDNDEIERVRNLETNTDPLTPQTSIKTVDPEQQLLYEALLQATTRHHTLLAVALLDAGADPKIGDHNGRLGKTTKRNDRKELFSSSPLHLAAFQGNDILVSRLLRSGSRFTVPDASGMYPLHLAASGRSGVDYDPAEDSRRWKIVQLFLDAGAPIAMLDGNKQSVLHCASRSGQYQTLSGAIERWKATVPSPRSSSYSFLDWRDRWLRTAVHWSVLNRQDNVLAVLLEAGCKKDPPRPKINNRSSAAVESPMEICLRLFDGSNVRCLRILALLSDDE